MLVAIKHYFSQHKTASLQELSLQFKQSPDYIRNMLQHWLRKDQLHLLARPIQCGKRCQLCKPTVAEVYQWKDQQHSLNAIPTAAKPCQNTRSINK